MNIENDIASKNGALDENSPLPGLDAFKTKKMSALTVAIFCIVALICASSIPAAIVEAFPSLSVTSVNMPTVTLVALIASAIFIIFFVRQFLLALISIVVYLFGSTLLGADALPILVLSFISTAIAYSFLATMLKKQAIALLISLPVLSYLAAFALTADPLLALASLAPYLPALAMGISTRYRATALTAVVSAAATLILPAAIALIIYMSVTGYDLRELSDMVRPQAVTFVNSQVLSYYNEFLVALNDLAADSNLAVEEIYDPGEFKMIIEEFMLMTEYMVTGLFNILLGVGVCITLIVCHLVRSSQISLLIRYKGHKYITLRSVVLRMGFISAILFILACVLALSTDAAGIPDMVSAVGTNLALMLFPGMLITGYYTIMQLVTSAVQSKKTFLLILIAITTLILTFLLFYYVLLILALVGAGFEIVMAAKGWAKNKNSKGET